VIFEADGQRLVLTGSFRGAVNTRVLTARLVERGAVVTSSVSSNTTAVVVGQRKYATVAEETARRRGLIILSEAEALELVEHGAVELSDPDRTLSPLDDLIAQARGALDGAPDARTWDTLVGLFDRCAPAHEPALVDYLAPALDRWRVPHDARYAPASPPDDDWEAIWADACPTGILRVLPRAWMTEGVQGRARPRFTLARAVVLAGGNLLNTDIETLLGLDALSEVAYLDMRRVGVTPSGRALTALASSPMAASLRDLRLPAFKAAHARALDTTSPLAPTHLLLSLKPYDFESDALRQLAASTWSSRLDTLTVDIQFARSSFFVTPDLSAFTGLSRATLHCSDHLRAFRDYVVAGPSADTLALSGQVRRADRRDANALLATPYDRAPTLDLSALHVDPAGLRSEAGRRLDMASLLIDRLPGSPFGSSFSSVRLGHWHTPERADAFGASGVTALDPPEPS
jgi:hypothetical protein